MSDISPEDGYGQGDARSRDGDALKGEAQAARERVGEAAQSVRQEAAHFAEATRDKASEQVDRGKAAVTTAVGEFADAIRKAGEELAGKDQTMAGRLATQAADGLQALSRTVSEQSPEDMLDAVRRFGRDNPTAFLAGAVLAGVALGRFARSSAKHDPATTSQTPASPTTAEATPQRDVFLSDNPQAGSDRIGGAFGAQGGDLSQGSTQMDPLAGVDDGHNLDSEDEEAGLYRALSPGGQ